MSDSQAHKKMWKFIHTHTERSPVELPLFIRTFHKNGENVIRLDIPIKRIIISDKKSNPEQTRNSTQRN